LKTATSALKPDEPAPPDDPIVIIESITETLDWESVESPSYRTYIENLRSIGCPEKTIQDIIIADVNALFAERIKEVRGEPEQFEFWKNTMFGAMMDPDKLSDIQVLNKEKRALLKDLLGPDVEIPPDLLAGLRGVNPFETMLDFLPSSKQQDLMDLEQNYSMKMMKIMEDGRDTEALQALQEDRRN